MYVRSFSMFKFFILIFLLPMSSIHGKRLGNPKREMGLFNAIGLCPGGMFSCSQNGGCVPLKYVCDEEYDCSDGSDENSFLCYNKDLTIQTTQPRISCENNKFRCPSSYCVPRDYICDGTYDCPGHEDEKDCGK